MARSLLSQIFFALTFSLVTLIASISVLPRAIAGPVPCNHIRSCSAEYQKYVAADAVCQAEFSSFKCGEANRNTEYGKLLRSCTPEQMCVESQIFSVVYAAIPGCTAGAQKYAGEVLDGMSACQRAGAYECGKAFAPLFLHNLFIAPFFAVWDWGKRMAGAVEKPNIVENTKLINRGWVCLNPEGRWKMACEQIGGTFNNVAMGRMIMLGVRGGIARVVDEPRAVTARRVGVTERARASAGLASKTARAPIDAIRKRAQTPAAVIALNEFVSPTRQAAAPKREAPVRAVADVRRDEYMERLLGRQNTTVEQRRAFAELAFKAEPKGNTVFLDIQNSKMKYMNDHLKDKNLVTAVTNARLQLMFDELRAKYPNLAAKKVEYDDFKSGRFGFEFTDGKIPAGFADDLKRTMSDAEQKFIAELGEERIFD